MKASELIAQLQALVEEHGDLDVAVYNGRGSSSSAKTVELVGWDEQDHEFMIEP